MKSMKNKIIVEPQKTDTHKEEYFNNVEHF